MTKLDDVMKEHIAYIVYIEHRPFSFKDFRYFLVNGKQYTMKHGTFRNKISQMMQNEVELHTRSNPNFYTLKGCRFDNGKSMTGNHTEVTSKKITTQKLGRHPLYQILEGTSFGERAIHDIHLKLNIQDIYVCLVNNQTFKKIINRRNRGISLYYNDINNFTITLTFYPNTTCKIVIGCSDNPVSLDYEGINRLATTLCRIEERLSNLYFSSSIHVPNYNSWIITLWHIGRDSISEYSKEMFHCQWSLAEKILLRIYSKTIENKKRVRMEVQYNPNISIEELNKNFLEKI